MTTKKHAKRKAALKPPQLPTFEEWIASGTPDELIEQLDVRFVSETDRYDAATVIATIDEPFRFLDRYRRTWDRTTCLSHLMAEADFTFPEEGVYVRVDESVDEALTEAVIAAALSRLSTAGSVRRLRASVRDAIEWVQGEEQRKAGLEQERRNERAAGCIEQAGESAKDATVVALGETERRGDRWSGYYTDTSYTVLTRDAGGNWQDAGKRLPSQAMVKQQHPKALIAFRAPSGNCTVSVPNDKKPPKPTRRELEAELAKLRAKLETK